MRPFSQKVGDIPSVVIREARGSSVEAAQQSLGRQLASSEKMVCENVLFRGGPFQLEGVADTVDEAYAQIENQVPPFASISERQVISQPEWREIPVAARNEESVRLIVDSQLTSHAAVKVIRLVQPGRKGFLGIGRTLNQYEARVWQPAVITIKGTSDSLVSWTVQSETPTDNPDHSGLNLLLQRCASKANEMFVKSNNYLRPYLPGEPKFICAQEKCTNSCCKFSESRQVIVTQSFADAVKAQRGIPWQKFSTSFAGYCVLRTREQNKCVFVDEVNKCTIHAIKPRQCVSYPYEVAFYNLDPDGNLLFQSVKKVYDAFDFLGPHNEPIEFYKMSVPYHFLVPLLVYDSGCPGFTGDPISTQEYLSLVLSMFEPSRATNAVIRGQDPGQAGPTI